jgi:hypothetical protein
MHPASAAARPPVTRRSTGLAIPGRRRWGEPGNPHPPRRCPALTAAVADVQCGEGPSDLEERYSRPRAQAWRRARSKAALLGAEVREPWDSHGPMRSSPPTGLWTQAPPSARDLGSGHSDSEPEPDPGSRGGQPGRPTGHARPRSGRRTTDGPRPGRNDRAAGTLGHGHRANGTFGSAGSLIRVIGECRHRRSDLSPPAGLRTSRYSDAIAPTSGKSG